MANKNDFLQSIPQDVPFSISREFSAPRSLVFEVYSKAEHLAKWWGPKGADVTVKEFDFKPGGRFLYSMPAQDNTIWWGMFVYNEINEPELLTFVSSFADEDGNVIRAPFSPDFPLEIYNHLKFTEAGGKTTIHMTGAPVNASDAELDFYKAMHPSMQQGFAGTLAKLEEYLATLTT